MKKFIFILSLILAAVLFVRPLLALECGDVRPTSLSGLDDYIAKCYQKVEESKGQQATLQAAINVLNSKINLITAQVQKTTHEISQLEQDIASLATVVTDLDQTINQLATIYVARVRQSYIRRDPSSATLLLSSESLAKFLSRARYLAIIKSRDQRILTEIEQAKNSYESQKDVKITKQKEIQELKGKLVSQQTTLSLEQKSKRNLLAITQNSETRFQNILQQAQEELDALRLSQFTGKKDVKRGEVIGLMGNTGNSTGPHLHFGYYDISEVQGNDLFQKSSPLWYFTLSLNPTEVLEKRNLLFYAKSCDDIGSDSRRDIGSGNLSWPMDNPTISQCYGHTPYSFSYNSPKNGSFHDGLDMADREHPGVKAIDDGVAYFYRGSTSFGNNVRLFHKNGKMTLYLHLQ